MQEAINRLRNKKDDEGFTLIELLVVVVIIGVLVAIAVPVYLNYRKGAADKSAQSDVRGAVSTIEQFYTDNSNSYPNPTTAITGVAASFSLYNGSTTASSTSPAGWVTLSDKTKMTYIAGQTNSGSVSTYKVCAVNDNGSNKLYVYDSAVGGSVKTIANGAIATCS
ncbi:prepilin-type N-terminal cleavage/methylation domain-containing protein [Paractinoplanes lichenicola]|uniref:Prepilin-type N-terminal cleavage/methylation domain-containing protein n=1 Tax=Paractinoplanes lichenicola TaxID=2802976 RepID=A0ABS1W1J1_9ACTN|nr:prepilin-type N-terminal cleavage/methylation domain-containing protein [Actinoplanes lichenicola]MBL7260612.1 prepilin-type N-terminal cleavage/methylation domain-containing protein [Actinoplanes lichenicola]